MSHTPLGVLQQLILDYQQGSVSDDHFVGGLDLVDQHLQCWAEQLQQLEVPPGYDQGHAYLEASLDGLDCLAQAVEALREYAESGLQDCLEEGLERAQQGQQQLELLLTQSQQAAEQLESEL